MAKLNQDFKKMKKVFLIYRDFGHGLDIVSICDSMDNVLENIKEFMEFRHNIPKDQVLINSINPRCIVASKIGESDLYFKETFDVELLIINELCDFTFYSAG